MDKKNFLSEIPGVKFNLNNKLMTNDKTDSIRYKNSIDALKKKINISFNKPTQIIKKNMSNNNLHKRSLSYNYDALTNKTEENMVIKNISSTLAKNKYAIATTNSILTVPEENINNDPKITIETFIIPERNEKEEFKINFGELIKLKNLSNKPLELVFNIESV